MWPFLSWFNGRGGKPKHSLPSPSHLPEIGPRMLWKRRWKWLNVEKLWKYISRQMNKIHRLYCSYDKLYSMELIIVLGVGLLLLLWLLKSQKKPVRKHTDTFVTYSASKFCFNKLCVDGGRDVIFVRNLVRLLVDFLLVSNLLVYLTNLKKYPKQDHPGFTLNPYATHK